MSSKEDTLVENDFINARLDDDDQYEDLFGPEHPPSSLGVPNVRINEESDDMSENKTVNRGSVPAPINAARFRSPFATGPRLPDVLNAEKVTELQPTIIGQNHHHQVLRTADEKEKEKQHISATILGTDISEITSIASNLKEDLDIEGQTDASKEDGSPIVIEDDPPTVIKEEYSKSSSSHWLYLEDGTIEILDSDEESALSRHPSPVVLSLHPINGDSEVGKMDMESEVEQAKDQQAEFVSTQTDYSEIYGNSTTVKLSIEASKMQQLQKSLAERALGKPLAAEVMFTGFQPAPIHSTGTNEEDPNAWMNATVDSDADAAVMFEAIKTDYRKKEQAGKIDWKDEILFKKAQNAERGRLKRLRNDFHSADGFIQDETTVETGEEELFVSQTFSPRGRKRTQAEAMKCDDGGLEEQEVNEYVIVDPLTEPACAKDRSNDDLEACNLAKPMSKKKHAKDVENEKEASLLAGIEADLAKDKAKKSRKRGGLEKSSVSKSCRKKPKAGAKKVTDKTIDKTLKKKKGASKQRQTKKPKPHESGYMNDFESLIHGNFNVYEDATSNFNRPGLPTIAHADKGKALTALLASVPLGEKVGARGQRADILRAITSLGGSRKVKADGEGNWKMQGMKSSLLHHQILGTSWMRKRETGNDQPLGGLQADEMGFGKTVMMLATMVANQPGSEDSKCTLIVCTPALLTQWRDELIKHVESDIFPRVIRYQSSTGVAVFGRQCESFMANADVVLTTYQEILRSYPKYNPPKDIILPEKKLDWWTEAYNKNRGLLHRIHFFRIVLDEAQAIKNHKSQTSIACRGLMAKHRWAISGTPIQNIVEELYPFFKFLRVKHTGTLNVFKENFCDLESEDSKFRLHSFLKTFMIRRSHKNTLFGAPLVKLPEISQATHIIDFNVVERAIYEIVKTRYIKRINNRSREGTLEKSYRNVLTMLLRLRQLTAHPFLVQETIEDLFEAEDVEKIWRLTEPEVSADENPGKDMLRMMRKMLDERDNPSEPSLDNPPDTNTQSEESSLSLPLIFKFRKFLRELSSGSKWSDLKNRSLCHKCRDIPDDPWVTDCLHVYCHECLNALAYEAAQNEETEAACLECGYIFKESRPCTGVAELDMNDDPHSRAPRSAPRPRRDPDGDTKWINLDGKLLPSAKTAAVQAQIQKWLEAEPDKKVIIFSQFRTLLKILARICSQEGWKYCRYDGNMSLNARDQSINDFRNDASTKIMIASLKCGGVGLNLTMASKVVCVDLWWNSSVEQQAFCRVFRFGQKSKTFITRFIVKNTVDEKLQEMQDNKSKEIGDAIDDKSMLDKLSLTDLMRLFGPVSMDADHKPFILVDDDAEFDSIVPKRIDDNEDATLPPRQARGQSELSDQS